MLFGDVGCRTTRCADESIARAPARARPQAPVLAAAPHDARELEGAPV